MAKKRANGEGSIRKKPSGRWEGRYTQGIDPVTGRAIQKSVSAKTQAECKEKLAKAIRENRGVPLNHTGDYTAAEWCRLWFETYSKPNIRYNTAKGYEGIIEHHIIPAIGAIKLKQLSSIHIQRMYNDLKENGRMPRGAKQNDKALSNTFVRRVHAVLQAALKQAVKERLIPHNPCENCRIPPKDKKEMTILPPEKIGRYLQEAEKYGVLPMFYLELSSGLRRGELLALQWEDLNVKERILTVNKQVTRMEGELDVTEPKTKNSVRKVALSQQAVDLLVQEHELHPDNPILFPSPRTGGYWSPDAVSRINRKLLKNAGIEEHVRFHDLRHTFATLALENGMDVKTLSAMLGHVSAATTLDIYTHITDDMRLTAAANIDRGIGKVAPQEDASESGQETAPAQAEKPRMTDFKPYVGRKRRSGTGCVSEINDHLFEGRYSPKWPDGKKHARNVYAHTREECEEKLKVLIVEMKAEIAEAQRLKDEGKGDGRPIEGKEGKRGKKK